MAKFNNKPLSFTVEHLTPKSEGGTNDLRNLTAAHKICNSLRDTIPHRKLPSDFGAMCRRAVYLEKRGVRVSNHVRKAIWRGAPVSRIMKPV